MLTTTPVIEDLKENMLDDIKVVHSTGIYPEITVKAFEWARKKKIVTSFDLEKQIAIRGIDELKPILNLVDILLPNKAGAMELTGTNDPLEAAKIFLSWGIKIVVITVYGRSTPTFGIVII